MAFLVRCPCCAAPKRIDPQRAWDPETVECPRCASAYEACAGHGFFTHNERGPWTRFLGASPTMMFALEQQRAVAAARNRMLYGYDAVELVFDHDQVRYRPLEAFHTLVPVDRVA